MEHHRHNQAAPHRQPSPTPHTTSAFPLYIDSQPSVRFYCKANPNYSVTIRGGKVVLAPTNPSDYHQHWIKETTLSMRVKDRDGFPSFALVNKATGQAIKHSILPCFAVQLADYNPSMLDQSVLWTESTDLGGGYHAIRRWSDIGLNLDAYNGDGQRGGVYNGTKVVVWWWKRGDNQMWATAPFC